MNDQSWRRVWDALQTARNLPVDERLHYAESAVTDPEEREELLAMLASEGSRLDEQSIFAPAPNAVEHTWSRLGKSFGRFVVTDPLGRGGMGEVYKAFDTELQRTVALKFLETDGTGAGEALPRFIREAQAASALNHPGIVTVYDVLRIDFAIGIVMELIEGISLRSMCGKPHSADQVAAWVRQIAVALAAAHKAGIVHRDIKPENLMLRPDGFLKVLDFGLARHVGGSLLSSGNVGFAGTLRYMSPEQVHGEPAQPPSDIFTLGIVMYELATGVHPFGSDPAGQNQTGDAPLTTPYPHCDALLVPYAITTRAPVAPSRLQPSIPAELDALVLEMLDKDPAKRPSAAAVAERLAAVQPVRAGSSSRRGKRTPLQLARTAGVAVLLAALVGGFYFWSQWFWSQWTSRQHPAAPVVIDGEPLTASPGNETNPAFSPDGRQIAYAWDGGGDRRERSIYVRLLDGGNPLRLTSGADDDNPVWSPDASRIAFLRTSKSGVQVVMVPALGGALRTVARIADARLTERRLLAWSTEPDELIVANNASSPDGLHMHLHRLTINSGQKQNLTNPPEGADDLEPVLSPDRRKLAFLRRHGALYQIYVISGRGIAPRKIATAIDVVGLAWSADGTSLVLATAESIPRRVLVVPEGGGEAASAPFQFGAAVSDLAISPDGLRMAFVQEQRDTNIWAKSDKTNTLQPLITSTRSDEDPSISPDGSRIAFTSDRTGKFEIWVSDRDGSNAHPVTSQRTFAGSTAWSPDGRTLAYDASVGGPTEIWLVSADGGQPRRLLDPPRPGFIPSWSADGSSIYFVGKGRQIWRAPVTGGQVVQVTRNGGFDRFETPDGKYMYFSKGIMTRGIWRLPLDGSGGEELVPELASVVPFRSWAMTNGGIYYAESEPEPVLKFLRFQDRKTVVIAPLAKPPSRAERGLAVSADGRLILYVQVDTIRNQIMVAPIPR